jgi:mercuric ion binding protein
MQYKFFSSLALLLLASTWLSAQATYTLTLDIPENVTQQEVKQLFDRHAALRVIMISENAITLVNGDEETYTIDFIREILAARQVAATAFEVTEMVTAPQAVSRKLETTRFKVYGNCGMCKDRIERALKSQKGVVAASWDEETMMVGVKYQASLITLEELHQAAALAGHDTDQARTSDETYDNLHFCCKYERPKETPAGKKKRK